MKSGFTHVFQSLLTVVFIALACSSPAKADTINASSTGVFQNPVGGADNSTPVTTGVGTSDFTWGDGDGFGTGPNEVKFTGPSISSATNTSFTVGSFSYFNGTTALGTNVDSVDLDVTLTITNPAIGAVVFPFTLDITTTPNTGTDAQNADILSLTNLFTNQTFDIGGNKYTLLLLGFTNPNISAGFVDAAGWHVFEGATGTADLGAEITLASNTVPEPASLTLLGFGLAGLGYHLRKKKI